MNWNEDGVSCVVGEEWKWRLEEEVMVLVKMIIV